ncbi:MAG TPA: hypothetical protein VJK03_00930 [Candidatus Nanoarchaeia archaeon]|nr:hypothetical protein [Candidatus Nanoarchaeia archaeon]
MSDVKMIRKEEYRNPVDGLNASEMIELLAKMHQEKLKRERDIANYLATAQTVYRIPRDNWGAT